MIRPSPAKKSFSRDCNMNIERTIGFLLGVMATAGFVWALQSPLAGPQSMDVNVRLITFPVNGNNEDAADADDDDKSSTGSVTLV